MKAYLLASLRVSNIHNKKQVIIFVRKMEEKLPKMVDRLLRPNENRFLVNTSKVLKENFLGENSLIIFYQKTMRTSLQSKENEIILRGKKQSSYVCKKIQ